MPANGLIVKENGHLKVGDFTLATTGVQVDGSPSFEEWQEAFEFVKRANSGVMWWIGDLLNYGETNYGETYTQAMEATGLEYQTLANAKWVTNAVEFSLRKENLSFGHHNIVAGLKTSEQKKWLSKADKEGWSVSVLRDAVREEKLLEASEANPLPADKYRVLYADPPWCYGDKLIEGYGSAEHHYPSMTTDELCALSVGPLALDDAVLFLWATVPMLPDAFRVCEAWNFEYKTLFVWDKVRHNYGHYNSVRAELLLICTRGSCLPDSKELMDSVITIERSPKHSEKPEEFRKLIDTLYTTGSRVELFARKKTDGWDSWGNEVKDGE